MNGIEIIKAKLTVVKKKPPPLPRRVLMAIGNSLRDYFYDDQPVPEAITKLMERLRHNDQERTAPPK